MDRKSKAPVLDELVGAIREIACIPCSPHETASKVATTLDTFLKRPDLVPDEFRVGDADRYRQHIVHSEHDGSFSVVVLVWMPGQQTPIHDHIAWCVAGVYEGAETETRYQIEGEGPTLRLVPGQVVNNPAGVAVGFAPPGDIHMVRNTLDQPVIAIHVYGAAIDRLGTSVRRTYDHLPVASPAAAGV